MTDERGRFLKQVPVEALMLACSLRSNEIRFVLQHPLGNIRMDSEFLDTLSVRGLFVPEVFLCQAPIETHAGKDVCEQLSALSKLAISTGTRKPDIERSVPLCDSLSLRVVEDAEGRQFVFDDRLHVPILRDLIVPK